MPEPRPLIFQLYTTYQRAGRLVARALEGTGIRPEDAALYSALDRHGPLTPGALADQLGVGLEHTDLPAQGARGGGSPRPPAEPRRRPLGARRALA